MSTVLIAGGSGLIGSRLSEALKGKGLEVLHLSRRKRPDAEFTTYQWDIDKGFVEEEAIRRADYVINVSGAGIADKPWTQKRKEAIVSSRVDGNRLLRSEFERLGHKPRAFLSSAAVGYYGGRGDEWLDETAEPDTGFYSESCIAWEESIMEMKEEAGIRTVAFRLGIVLSTQGGALEKILLPFHFFLGTYFGNGQQWYSWIHIDDVCRMFAYAMENEQMEGIYNGVSPHPVTNKKLVEELKHALDKPALVMPVPAIALRLAMGEMADVILSSARASSQKLERAGFEFGHPDLPEALKDLLEKKK